MISEKNIAKVKKFIDVVSDMQFGPGKQIGLLILKKEETKDISILAPNSNITTVLELSKDGDADEVIGYLADAVKSGRLIFIRLHDYLDPKIYNQLFLLSKNSRMEYPKLEERIFVDAAPETTIIVITTDNELNKLNYTNILDLSGLVERL
ncbi:MAG: hypothetical protein NTW66_02660 [Candidatus Magasanikbacteria bacterium]|nr:hypothetical protein [Candidatus Magasanikbacteria bacterium]